MKRTVTVLQDDIDHGVKRHASQCPVARAMNRDLADQYPHSHVTVQPFVVAVNGHPVGIPKSATDFITRFDNGFPVEPFKFEIEVPQ